MAENGSCSKHTEGPVLTSEDPGALDGILHGIVEHKKFVAQDVSWGAFSERVVHKLDVILRKEYDSPADTKGSQASDIPESLEVLHKRIIARFQMLFSEDPPFTIVRLAEILLNPKGLYFTAAKFLHAIDTVISVSSTHSQFVEDKGTENMGNGDHVTPDAVPVASGDDSQTILLTKINWLTEEDVKMVQSESYLAPGVEQTEEGEDRCEDNQDSDKRTEQERAVQNDEKKRKQESESGGESNEKKAKFQEEEVNADSPQDDFETDPISESDEDQDQDPNTTLPEDKMVDDGIQGYSSSRDDVSAEVLIEGDRDQIEDATEQDKTLPEDKMDIDGT